MQTITTYDVFRNKIEKQKQKEKNAYMLFYERNEKSHGPALTEDSQVKENDNIIKMPELKKRGNDDFDDGSVPPFLDTVFYHDIKKIQQEVRKKDTPRVNDIPKKIYDAIWKENAAFLRDAQFFDPSYFDFILSFASLATWRDQLWYPSRLDNLIWQEELMENDEAFLHLVITTQCFFGAFIHSKDKNVEKLDKWVEVLSSSFRRHLPACVWFLDHMVATDAIREVILLCPDEMTRIFVSRLISRVLAFLAPYESDFWDERIDFTIVRHSERFLTKRYRGACLRLMDNVIDNLDESRKSWPRFKQYFRLFRDFAKINWQARRFLINNKSLFYRFNEYFMTKRKQAVMDSQRLPDLREFIETLAILLRGCKIEGTSVSVSPLARVEEGGKLLTLSESNERDIFEEEFFQSLLEMDYNTEAAIQILLHTCWESEGRSRWVMDILLNSFEIKEQHKIVVFQKLLRPLLDLKDSLQDRRIYWALTPFKTADARDMHSYNLPVGLMGIVREKYHTYSNLDVAVMLARYIISLAQDVKRVYIFLLAHKGELYFLRDFLESHVRFEPYCLFLFSHVFGSILGENLRIRK